MPVPSRKLWKNLSQEQKEKRKERQRKWYAKPENKERKAMQNRKWCLENKDKRQESWRRYREKNRAKINEKTQKRRHENRETFNAERRARYHAKKIAQQVIGQESDLNADHVKIVTARWPHVAEREALQYLYPKEVKYLWIKGELENSE